MVGQHANPYLRQLVRLPFYLLAISVLFPYYWMVTSAFKPVNEIVRRPPPMFIERPTLQNFYDPEYARLTDEEKAALAKSRNDPNAEQKWAGLFERVKLPMFLRTFANSLGIAAIVTVVTILLASMAAYVLVRKPFPGSSFIFIVLLGSMMVPWQVTLIPNFLVTKSLGWLNNSVALLPYLALIVPALPKAFAVFFFRQAIVTMPHDLFEAARIDGASELRIWWQIVLPLLRPSIAAIAIFVALGEWNNFLWPLIIVRDDAHFTVPIMIARLAGSLGSDPLSGGVIMAATLLASIPAVIFFVFFQRQFIEGLTGGSLKG
jgi:ABC-type glycerol-3-phosphate transport system permease component